MSDTAITNDEDVTNTIAMIIVACLVIVGLYFVFRYTCSGGTNDWKDGSFGKCFIIPGLDFGGGGGGGNGPYGPGNPAPPGWRTSACNSPEALNNKPTCVSNTVCQWDAYYGTSGRCILNSEQATPLNCPSYTTSATCPISVCEWDTTSSTCKRPFAPTPCYEIGDDINACLSNGCVYNTYYLTSTDVNTYAGDDSRINDAQRLACVYSQDELLPFECTNLTREQCLTNAKAHDECEWNTTHNVCFNRGDNARRCMSNFLTCALGTLGKVVTRNTEQTWEEVDDFFGDLGDSIVDIFT